MLNVFCFFLFLFFCFCLFFFFFFFGASHALSPGDKQKAKFIQVRRFTENDYVYALHSLIGRHSVQNVFQLEK